MLNKLPIDIVQPIFLFVLANDIGRLWLSGDSRIRQLLLMGVEELRLVWEGPGALVWPPLLSIFPRTHLVSIQLHAETTALGIDFINLRALPKGLKTFSCILARECHFSTVFAAVDPTEHCTGRSLEEKSKRDSTYDPSAPRKFVHFRAELPNLTSLSIWNLDRFYDQDMLDLPRGLLSLAVHSNFATRSKHWPLFLPPRLEHLAFTTSLAYLRANVKPPLVDLNQLPPEPHFSFANLKSFILVDKPSPMLIEALSPECQITSAVKSPIQVMRGKEARLLSTLIPKNVVSLAASIPESFQVTHELLPRTLVSLYLTASSMTDLGDMSVLFPHMTLLHVIPKMSVQSTLCLDALPPKLTNLRWIVTKILRFDPTKLADLSSLKCFHLEITQNDLFNSTIWKSLPPSLEEYSCDNLDLEQLQVLHAPNLKTLRSNKLDRRLTVDELREFLPRNLTYLSGLSPWPEYFGALPHSLKSLSCARPPTSLGKSRGEFKDTVVFPPNLTFLEMVLHQNLKWTQFSGITQLPLKTLNLELPNDLSVSIIRNLPPSLTALELSGYNLVAEDVYALGGYHKRIRSLRLQEFKANNFSSVLLPKSITYTNIRTDT